MEKVYNCIVVFNRTKDAALFCLRKKDPYKGRYNFVGGKVNPGESSENAAYRELEEETGITRQQIHIYRLMDIRYYHQDFDLELYVGQLKKDIVLKEEINPLTWISLDEDFADRNRFAGEQNIAHIMNVALKYPIPNETVQYYEENAENFVSGTIHADMNEARHRFLKLLPQGARILDFGCGSGRDTKAFLEQGYKVDAVDGSWELCRQASEYTGIPVRQMLFQDLDIYNYYDGIWACASILHLSRMELADVLRRITSALKPDGILYASFKYGSFEGMRNGRYFTDFTETSLTKLWTGIESLPIIDTWVTKDVRPGREEERWINLLARRI